MNIIYRCPECQRFLINIKDNEYFCSNLLCEFKDIIFVIEENIDKDTKEKIGFNFTYKRRTDEK